ncbi:hypothetical protein YQE_02014, partial [Dendroctonus ponderosae]
MLLYLSTTGDVLARSFRRLYGKICGSKIASQKPQQQCPCSNNVRVPVTICLVIVLAYICSGAMLFRRLENWSLLEGSYFCFTSLGTIGFGDLLPGQNTEEISLCACSAYILTGMALVAMCFSLVQDQVVALLRPTTEGAAPSKIGGRRSPPTLHHNTAEPSIEYFVPRSMSEFDLSIATESPPLPNFMPLTVRAPRKMSTNSTAKQKEKMVTFEDEMSSRRDVKLSDLGNLENVKKELKAFKNFKLCEHLKRCEDNCSCNAEQDCDMCKVLDFTLKQDKL